MWLFRFESWPGSLDRQVARNAANVTSHSSSDIGDPPRTSGASEPSFRPGPSDSLAAVILAAGQGTRMRSRRHKVLHPLAGKPLISRVLDLVTTAGAAHVVVVLGHQADQVRAVLPESVDVVIQEPQLGTGHATQVAAQAVQRSNAARVLIHYGDVALVKSSSLQRLVDAGVTGDAPLALLTARVREPHGYGRIIRTPDGTIVGTVEEVDATAEQRLLDEVWGGTLLARADWLWEHLPRLPLSPKGEYYLPDLVNLARGEGRSVRAVQVDAEDELHGVNDRLQLAQANAILRQRTLEALMRSGVTIVDPATTYVDPEVEIEPDVVLQPGCHLQGHTRIAADCEIGPHSMLVDSEIAEGSRIWYSVLENARVGRQVNVGPFSHLRPGAVIEDGAQLGNFAEVKGSRIGAGTQMHHFSYVGDADVGERVNLGAGTVTVNFSSETRAKSRTLIDDDASIGSDTMLVAPVHVGSGAITGAGSVVTRDVPDGEVWAGVPARPLRARRQPRPDDHPAP
jgi:bifunctional UDP-N-acetylglucosamine pyrophosphorylase / glucosamine-1-phosphate N-acetyltransferase